MKYILVPELHKDGAVHFHGFINDALPVVDSGTLSHGGKPKKPRTKAERERLLALGWRVVYNLPDWAFGFSTAVELYGEYEAAVAYCCKYIGKDMGAEAAPDGGAEGQPQPSGKLGGRWYYSGGGLQQPEVAALDLDFDRLLAEHPDGCWSMSGGTPDMVRFYVREGWNFDDSYIPYSTGPDFDAAGALGVFRDTDAEAPREWRE